MIKYVYGDDERLAAWASGRLSPNHRLRSDVRTIGIEVDGSLRAVIAFDTFSTIDCLMTVVADSPHRNWVTRELMIRAMAYPFVQCGFPRITCIVSANNRQSIRFIRRFGGWQLEGVLREAGDDGEAMLLYGMLRRDCPRVSLPLLPMTV